MLKDMRCKPLRECLLVVIHLQRELARLGKQVRELVKGEKEKNAEFWRLTA